MLSDSPAQRKWQRQSESPASHPSIRWLRSLASSLTVSSSHTASNLEQIRWAPPSRPPHESAGCSACIHPGLSCVVSHRVTATASSPARLQKRVATVCASVTLMLLWPTPPSPTSLPPSLPFTLRSSRPGCLIAPGVHQNPPAPGPLPCRSCCLGCVPRHPQGTPPTSDALVQISPPRGAAPRLPRGSALCPLASHLVPSCSTFSPSYCLYYPT